jgi:hypothetical protein
MHPQQIDDNKDNSHIYTKAGYLHQRWIKQKKICYNFLLIFFSLMKDFLGGKKQR